METPIEVLLNQWVVEPSMFMRTWITVKIRKYVDEGLTDLEMYANGLS